MNRLIKTWLDKLFNIPKRPTRWQYVSSNTKQTFCNNRLRRILPKIFCLFLFCGIANAEAWKGQVTRTTLDGVNTYGDGAPGSKPYIYTEIYDGQENKEVQVSPIKELRVVMGHRLVGSTFNNGFFDYNFWSSGTVTSGTISVSSGSLTLYASSSTTGAIDGASIVQSLRTARFVSGSANEYRAVIRISTNIPTTGTNDMRWGLSDATGISTNTPVVNGFYFRYANGAFYVGSRLAGTEMNVATTSFNGTVPTITTAFTRYQIVYTNIGATFYVNDKMVHRLSPTIASLTETVSFKARAQNFNSNGSNSTNSLEAKVLTILRLGSESTTPVKKYIGTAGSYLLKFGPGFFHHITINDPGAVGSAINVYDSTFTSTSNLIGVLNTAKTSIGSLDYDCPFDNGLFIVPSGTFGNITVVYE